MYSASIPLAYFGLQYLQTLSFLGKNTKFAGQMSDDQLLMAEPCCLC